MSTEPIRIRITRREADEPSSADRRRAFWAPYLDVGDRSRGNTLGELESKLCRQFGRDLRNQLVYHLRDTIFRNQDDHNLDRFMFRFDKGPESSFEWASAYEKFIDYRIELLRSNPAIQRERIRIVEAVSLIFSTRIASYSSLNLELSMGSLEKVAKVFDSNFESFRVFLEAFVPLAFANVFSEDFADLHAFEISIPTSFTTAFSSVPSSPNPPSAPAAVPVQAAASPTPAPVRSTFSDAALNSREKAEWAWRLANGSLLVPLLIALAVMFFGFREVSQLQRTQFEAIKPILEHQLELLKEDRLRLTATPAPAAMQATPASTPARTTLLPGPSARGSK
jgi:hypothetical protein